jgi:hypothetical protein
MAVTVYLAFVNLFAPRSPVPDAEREWIETQLRWLVTEFGDGALRGEAVLPTDDFFPGVYRGDADDVSQVIESVSARMGVTHGSFTVEMADVDDGQLDGLLPGYRASSGAAGEYSRHGGTGVIAISMTQADRPMALVATIAHEFGHHRLMGENRVEPGRRDNEPLTDLATVFFGFGANAARDFAATERYGSTGARLVGWRASRLGYLTEPMWGYALAYWAHLRGERDPGWARHLDTNPRAYMKRGLRYLD